MEYYLVINLGLRSIRIILFDKSAHIIERNWYPVQTYIKGDTVEQDTLEWWALCKRLLTEVLGKKKDYRDNLKSITVTTSASCLVALDKNGKVLTRAIMVSDKRASAEATDLKKKKSLRRIFKEANNLASPAFMIPKILWMQNHVPKIANRAHFFLSSNDFLIYKLTGQLVTDPLNAEKFYYDQKKKRYPSEILRFLRLPEESFPKVVPIGTSIGLLSEDLVRLTGISSKTKVVISSYDAICAFVGSGAVHDGDANNVCGTVSSVRAFTKKNVRGKNGLLSQQCNDFRMVGGSNNIDGGLLEWSKGMFYGDTYPDKYVYTIMAEEADESTLGANGLLFLPYLIGERVPFVDHTMRGIFFGLERSHNRADIMRSIFEASGFMAYDILSNIEKIGVKVRNIRMSGGLTASSIACKIRADITGKTVYVTNDPETTSMGALFILLVEDGKYKNLHQAAKLVTFSHVYKPNLKNHRIYMQLFTLFKKIYGQNQVLMIERKRLIDDYLSIAPKVLENL
jgi:xylulokinase